jgi:hypothetical protein
VVEESKVSRRTAMRELLEFMGNRNSFIDQTDKRFWKAI